MVIYYLIMLLQFAIAVYSIYAIYMSWNKRSYVWDVVVNQITEKLTFIPEQYRVIALFIGWGVILSFILNLIAWMFISHQVNAQLQDYYNAANNFNKAMMNK